MLAGIYARNIASAPSFDIDFFGSSLDPIGQFARGTTSNYFNANGNMTALTGAQPRFDYNPATLAPRGLLMEEGRTNLCLRSAAWTNAAWTRANMSATASTQTGMDGTADYGSLTASAANGTCLQTITVANGTLYAFSVDMKRLVGTGSVQLTMDGGTTWTTVTVPATLDRVSMTQTATSTSMTVGIRIQTNADSIAAGGAQLEAGAFPTSRLPTAGSSVQRNNETLGFQLPVAWFADSPFTLYFEAEVANFATSAIQRFVQMSDGSSNNRLLLSADAGGNLTAQVTVNGSATSTATMAVAQTGTIYKMAASYRSDGGLRFAVNGAVSDLTAAKAQISAMTVFNLGQSANGGALWLRRMKFYKRALMPAQLAALTA